jgi:hypothetical protein
MKLTKTEKRIHYYNIPDTLANFLRAREEATPVKHSSPCLHPKNTKIGKKDTTFFEDCCHVRFDRKTLPKSGKSILNGTFIENKGYAYLVWDRETRALFGLVYDESELDSKTKEWKRRFNEQYGVIISR